VFCMTVFTHNAAHAVPAGHPYADYIVEVQKRQGSTANFHTFFLHIIQQLTHKGHLTPATTAAAASIMHPLSSLTPPMMDDDHMDAALDAAVLNMWVDKSMSNNYRDAREGMRGLIQGQDRQDAQRSPSHSQLVAILQKGLGSYDQEQMRLSLSLLETAMAQHPEETSLLPAAFHSELVSVIHQLNHHPLSQALSRHLTVIVDQAIEEMDKQKSSNYDPEIERLLRQLKQELHQAAGKLMGPPSL